MDKRLTPARIALLYAAFASLWIFASDKMLALTVPDPALIVRISTFKGFAFVFITTWLLYQLMKTSATKVVPAVSSGAATNGVYKLGSLLAIFLGLALIVPLFGYSIAKIYTPRIQQAAFDDLSAVAELKASQVEAWLQERSDDADELAERAGFVDKAEQWLRNGDEDSKEYVLAHFDALARLHRYDPVLLRPDGRRALSPHALPDPVADRVWRGLLAEAHASGKPQHSELYRDASGRIRLDYIVPLHPHGRQRAAGAVVLRAPVEQFLFPLIRSWPTSSPSAETVLTRRDGDQVMFLNELRHRKDTALSLRLPLDTPGLAASSSILSGKPHTMVGSDYRGVRVMAATRPIQGTNWHLVA